jgi:hypothetical protein
LSPHPEQDVNVVALEQVRFNFVSYLLCSAKKSQHQARQFTIYSFARWALHPTKRVQASAIGLCSPIPGRRRAMTLRTLYQQLLTAIRRGSQASDTRSLVVTFQG